MPLAEKAAGVAGFMVAGPPGAIAARKGVAAGRYGVRAAKQVNTARKGYATAKKEKETHNSPSPKCQGDFNQLYNLIASREGFLDKKHTMNLSHDEIMRKKRDFDDKISKKYDEIIDCECRQNRCRSR